MGKSLPESRNFFSLIRIFSGNSTKKSYGILGKIFSGYLTKFKHTRGYADNKYHDKADEAVYDETSW